MDQARLMLGPCAPSGARSPGGMSPRPRVSLKVSSTTRISRWPLTGQSVEIRDPAVELSANGGASGQAGDRASTLGPVRAPVRQPRSAAPGKALVVRLLAVSVLLMAGTMGAGVAKASPGAPRAASADESPPPPPRLSAGPLRVPEPQLEQPDSALEDPDEIAQPGVEDDLPAERSIEIVVTHH